MLLFLFYLFCLWHANILMLREGVVKTLTEKTLLKFMTSIHNTRNPNRKMEEQTGNQGLFMKTRKEYKVY